MSRIKWVFALTLAGMIFIALPSNNTFAVTSVEYSAALGPQVVVGWYSDCTWRFENMNYHAQPFYVDADGSYTLETIVASGMPGISDDTHIALYTPSFNDADYIQNCIAHDDDTNGRFPEITHNLTANTQYILVTMHSYTGSGAGATFTNRIAGTGNIVLGFVPRDGRLNPRLGDIDVVISPGRDRTGNNTMHIYCVNQLTAVGDIAMVITPQDLPTSAVSENTLLLESDICEGGVEFYALEAGGRYAYQVNVGPNIEGTVHEYLFNDLNGANLIMRTFNLYELGD